jgi:hypothetical protein
MFCHKRSPGDSEPNRREARAKSEASRRLKRRPRTISDRISNNIWAPTIAVLVVGSYCGATSTTSPPTMSIPLSPCRIPCTSRGVRPPTSGVPVPGA